MGAAGVGEVGGEVAFEMGRDGLLGGAGDDLEELGVGLVGKAVAAGTDVGAGVEVAVGKVLRELAGGGVGGEIGDFAAELGYGAVDALDVKAFREGDGSLDGEIAQGADAWGG